MKTKAQMKTELFAAVEAELEDWVSSWDEFESGEEMLQWIIARNVTLELESIDLTIQQTVAAINNRPMP